METGWYFVFGLFIGIPVIALLGLSFVAWLNYRYMRATLETLKAYAANGREPPEALVKALTEGGRRMRRRHASVWGTEAELEEPPEDLAETRAQRRAYRWKYHYRHRHSAVRAWRGAFFWAALTFGFWYAAEYVSMGDARDSLTIVAIITGAVTAAATLSAVLTTIVRASERPAD